MRIHRPPVDPHEQPSPSSRDLNEFFINANGILLYQRIRESSGVEKYDSFFEFVNTALSLGLENVKKGKSPTQQEAIRDAYWAVSLSADAENAYARGKNGGGLVGEASPVVKEIESTIHQNSTLDFAYRPFIYSMALNLRKGGYERTSHWKSISASLDAAHVPPSVKGLLYLESLRSVCRRKTYDVLAELTDPQTRFPISEGEEPLFWLKYLVGESRRKDGIKFYLGYNDGVIPIIKENAKEFFGEEWIDALKIWNALFFMTTSKKGDLATTLTTLRTPCLEALGRGDVARARILVRDLICTYPELFSKIAKKDFDITQEAILEYQISRSDERYRTAAAKRKEKIASDEQEKLGVLRGLQKGREILSQRVEQRKKEAIEIRKKNLLLMKDEIEKNDSYMSHLLVGAFLPESTSYPRLYFIEKQTEEKGNPAYTDVSYTDIHSDGSLYQRELPVPRMTVREYDMRGVNAKHTRTNTSMSAQKIYQAIADGKCIDLGVWDAGDFTEKFAHGIVQKLPTDIFDQWRKIKDRYR
ncbi:hypothetical protein HY621_03150 [Candidatus Uhrbacteria bacterium]|nr:hypothetical protein [Candidatus Uhrbacteria bacterium]